MAMTDNEKKDLRDYCAFLLKEFGFHFSPDDPVIPALYVVYKHMRLVSESNQAIASKVELAMQRVKPKEFHFHHPGEAWTFQIASGFRWIVGGTMIVILAAIGSSHWSNRNDVNDARAIRQAYPNMAILFRQVQTNSEGIYFVDFTAASSDSIRHFFEYRRLDKKHVRVYLGKMTPPVAKDGKTE